MLYTGIMYIGELLKDLKPKRGTYWTDMVKECKDTINSERRGTKFPQLTFVAVRNKVEHLKDAELAYLLSVCKDAKNRKITTPDGKVISGSFSKVFFGSLKVKKDL